MSFKNIILLTKKYVKIKKTKIEILFLCVHFYLTKTSYFKFRFISEKFKRI